MSHIKYEKVHIPVGIKKDNNNRYFRSLSEFLNGFVVSIYTKKPIMPINVLGDTSLGIKYGDVIKASNHYNSLKLLKEPLAVYNTITDLEIKQESDHVLVKGVVSGEGLDSFNLDHKVDSISNTYSREFSVESDNNIYDFIIKNTAEFVKKSFKVYKHSVYTSLTIFDNFSIGEVYFNKGKIPFLNNMDFFTEEHYMFINDILVPDIINTIQNNMKPPVQDLLDKYPMFSKEIIILGLIKVALFNSELQLKFDNINLQILKDPSLCTLENYKNSNTAKFPFNDLLNTKNVNKITISKYSTKGKHILIPTALTPKTIETISLVSLDDNNFSKKT